MTDSPWETLRRVRIWDRDSRGREVCHYCGRRKLCQSVDNFDPEGTYTLAVCRACRPVHTYLAAVALLPTILDVIEHPEKYVVDVRDTAFGALLSTPETDVSKTEDPDADPR